MAEPKGLEGLAQWRKAVTDAKFGARPDISDITQEAADLRAYLGPTDYSQQLQQAQDAAKLQAALSLAARGFASMGATPKKGESPFATIGRELLAPVGADLIPVSTDLMKRKAAIDAAKQAEDRQVKLAAYTQAAARKKDQDTVALELWKTLGKSTDKLLAGHFVLYKTDDEGKPTTPVLDSDGSVTQGRQRGKTSVFTNMRTQKGFSPGKRQMMVKASDHFKGVGGSKGKAANVGYLQHRTTKKVIHMTRQGPGQPGFNSITGNPINNPGDWTYLGSTPPKDSDSDITGNFVLVDKAGEGVRDGEGRLIQLRQQGQNWIKLGGAGSGTAFSIPKDNEAMPVSNYFAKDPAPKDPKGVDSADAKANFEGFLNRFPAIQEAGALADTSIKFDPFRHARGEQPFTYLDGTSLSDADGKRILRMIETDYFNLYDKGFKAGQDPEDINQRAVTNFLKRSLRSYGLRPPTGAPTGDQRPPSQLVSKKAQLTRYKTASAGFDTQPVASETLDRMPDPNVANYPNGIGRLKLFQRIGVPFGPETTSPVPLNPNLPPQDLAEALNTRSADVARLSSEPDLVQTRIDAEQIAVGTDLAATLNATANTPAKRNLAVSQALRKVKEKRSEIQNKPGNKEAAKELGQAMQVYDKLSKVRVLLSRGRVPGFITGPLEVAGRQLFGLEIGSWTNSPQGQKAANEFIATLPIIQQLTARQQLRASGEGARMSNADLTGIQKVLPSAGKNFEYEKDKIKALDRHLREGIQSMLENIGDFQPSDALLVKAASLGFDLKGIKGKNNYYSPYLADKKYRVSKQPVPTYSKENQTQLRDKGVLNFVARSVPGQPVHYELMVIDSNGQPIWDAQNNTWRTTIVPGSGLSSPNNREMVRYNTDWLKKQHRLDR